MVSVDRLDGLYSTISDVFGCRVFSCIAEWNAAKNVEYPCIVLYIDRVSFNSKNQIHTASVEVVYNVNIPTNKRIEYNYDSVLLSDGFEAFREGLLRLSELFGLGDIDVSIIRFKGADSVLSYSCKLNVRFIKSVCLQRD